MTETPKNILETMRDTLSDTAHVDLIDAPNTPMAPNLVAVANGTRIEDITHLHRNAAEYQKPLRRTGTAQMADLDSLIAWANRFKGETSALFANPDMKNPTLTCIADYHAAGAVTVTDEHGDPTARHCHHRAVYTFPLSDEWCAWMKVAGEQLDKDNMGEFIEAQAKDIMDPTPAILAGKVSDKNQPWENRLIETAQKIEGRYGQLTQLLQMSRKFQVYETSNLTVTSNRDTGEGQIQFLNEHKDAEGKPISIPNLLIIAIPVFRGAAAYRMAVRFRYRKAGGNVKFFMSIYNPHKVFEAAIKQGIDTAAHQTDLPTFIGTPEK
jgi:hypothetical protein